MSFVGSTLSKSAVQNFQIHGQIKLIDNSVSPTDDDDTRDISQTRTEAQEDQESSEFLKLPLSKQTTQRSLSKQFADRKYRRFQQARYKDDDSSSTLKSTSRPQSTSRNSSARQTQDALHPTIEEHPAESSLDAAKSSRLRRGERKVKGFFRRRKQNVKDGDIAYDVLWENQRGGILFGLPKFSSASLLNFDSSPWVNGQGQPSSVNTTNAQLPDPGWEWAWSRWYVDMSSDVDEEGWQYSFMFQQRYSWHGTRPWFHSFVRRRRWLRKRIRKQDPSRLDQGLTQDSQNPHKLNNDYFTIHAPINKPSSQFNLGSSKRGSFTSQRQNGDDDDEDDSVISNMLSLFRRLKKVDLDRERISAVIEFIDNATDDLVYLSEEMPRILSLFLFQHSRRHLLAAMQLRIDRASDHRTEHNRRHQDESIDEHTRIDNLLRSAEAADKQIQKLEYWSDVRDMVQKGQSFAGVGEGPGWEHGWQGLDSSGPSKADMPKADEHGHIVNDEVAPSEATGAETLTH